MRTREVSMENRAWGWKKSLLDIRDWNLRQYMRLKSRISPGAAITEMMWLFNKESLNQGTTGHCVGFTGADFGISEPTFTDYTNADGHAFYYMCKAIEGDPKGEDGAYMRTMGQVLQNIGKIENYAFAPDLATIEFWLLNKGPLLAGTIWTNGMGSPDSNNVVHPTGAVAGGHAYLLNGFKPEKGIHFQNHWGQDWGINGGAWIAALDFEKLFMMGGEAIAAVELADALPEPPSPPTPPPPTNTGCLSLLTRSKNVSL